MPLIAAPPLTVSSFVAVLSLVFAWLHVKVNKIAPEPYMDEIFHVPQAQKYCQGRFDEWDPKITTFPGLYLVSMLYAKMIWWLNLKESCSVAVLRSVNGVFALGNVVLCVMLRRHVAPHDPNALLHAFRIAVFPPLFFFSFLFYTDAGATFFVLLMLLLAEKVDVLQAKRNCILSALSGAIAVLFRQTNVIWVVFVAATIVVRFVELVHSKSIYGSLKRSSDTSSALLSATNNSLSVFVNFVGVVVFNLPSILLLVWPFVVIVAAFVSFLLINGGIVVGDKSNHEVTFHGAQMLYFTIVAASGFGLNLVAPAQLQTFAASVRKNGSSFQGFLFIIFLVAATIGVIFRFSPVHKFMLADNRHYTFYVWRKYFLRHNLAKFLPTPFYLYFGWRCWKELGQRRSFLWRLVYFLAVCLVLIPSPLVEPRYYCVPFVILHLYAGDQSGFQLGVVAAAYMAVNVLTLYVFLYCPYKWVDGSTARFMW